MTTAAPSPASAVADLELDGEPAPAAPFQGRRQVIATKVPGHLYAYVREQAYTDHTTINAWMKRLIEQHRDGARYPADVRDWLCRQGAQIGCPGDPDTALVAVVRHLADRYPNGVRIKT